MAILRRHIPHYKEIYGLPCFFSEPVLLFGLQEIQHKLYDRPYQQLTFSEKFRKLRRALSSRYDVARGAAHPDLEIPPEFYATDLVTFCVTVESLKSRSWTTSTVAHRSATI